MCKANVQNNKTKARNVCTEMDVISWVIHSDHSQLIESQYCCSP